MQNLRLGHALRSPGTQPGATFSRAWLSWLAAPTFSQHSKLAPCRFPPRQRIQRTTGMHLGLNTRRHWPSGAHLLARLRVLRQADAAERALAQHAQQSVPRADLRVRSPEADAQAATWACGPERVLAAFERTWQVRGQALASVSSPPRAPCRRVLASRARARHEASQGPDHVAGASEWHGRLSGAARRRRVLAAAECCRHGGSANMTAKRTRARLACARVRIRGLQ